MNNLYDFSNGVRCKGCREINLKYILVILVLLCTGCAQTGESRSSGVLAQDSIEGVWGGKISHFTTKKLPGSDSTHLLEVVLSICEGKAEIWYKTKDDGYDKSHKKFNIQSVDGNYLISSIEDGGGWIETHTWSLVLIGNDKIDAQWSRMVSNPRLKNDDIQRSFGELGYGELKRISDDCNIRL